MAPGSRDGSSTKGSGSPTPVTTVRITFATEATKKKRVRRQQVELKYLRELVGQLEHRLEQLKKRRVSSTQKAKGHANGKLGKSNNYNMKHGPACVWEAIADRQFNERARAEKRNEELKALVSTQTSAVQTLQARAQKTLGDKELIRLTMMQLQDKGPRYWDLGSGGDEANFTDLLALVERTRLELQLRHVEDPRTVLSFATWGIALGEPQFRIDSDAGLLLETHGCSLLPFNVKTTAAACWKMFSMSHVNHEATFNDIATMQDDMVARSITCSSTHFGHKIEMRGKHFCRKFVDQDGCFTIVFAGRTEPANANAPNQEFQLQKTGWIKVRQLQCEEDPEQQSAVVEMHSETLPHFQNSDTGQEKRAREVIDWVSMSQCMANDWYRRTLSEILVEEDWKTFHGDDGMSVC